MEKKPNDDKPADQKPRWLPFVQPILATMTLLGAGVGGMLHFLNAGEGSPEYQMFVLRVSSFIILLLYFFLMLLTMGMIASESGKEESKREGKYAKFGIRVFTAVFMALLGLSAWGMLWSGGEVIRAGFSDYVASIKAQIPEN